MVNEAATALAGTARHVFKINCVRQSVRLVTFSSDIACPPVHAAHLSPFAQSFFASNVARNKPLARRNDPNRFRVGLAVAHGGTRAVPRDSASCPCGRGLSRG